MYLLYSIATLIALVVLSPFFLYQALRHKKYVGSFGQRLGYLPVSFNLDAEASIWVHAVSVGEVLAARPVVAELRKRYPALRIFLSTTTLSGQQLARRSVADVDGVFYFPFDWTVTVRRTLDAVKPRLFVMVENEIWPNLLRECRRRGIRTVRRERAASRGARSRAIAWSVRSSAACSPTWTGSACRARKPPAVCSALGADPARVVVTGSLKFDSLDTASLPGRGPARVLRFFRISPNRPVLIAGSTMKGEDEPVIRAFNRVRTAAGGHNALLIIAARHPERFAEVERLCRRRGCRRCGAASCRSTPSRAATR